MYTYGQEGPREVYTEYSMNNYPAPPAPSVRPSSTPAAHISAPFPLQESAQESQRNRIRMCPSRQKCSLGVIVFAVFSVLFCGGFAALLSTSLANMEREKAQWAATHFETVIDRVAGAPAPRPCCAVVGCTCTEAGSALTNCGIFLANLSEGACGNGYTCCSQRCETCYRTCQRESCSTCYRYRESCAGSGSSRYCQTVRDAYSCRCTYTPYNCDPYNCNCYCDRSVFNAACSSKCGTCHDPWITIAITLRNDAPDDSARLLLLLNRTAVCGMDDTTCVTNFFTVWSTGMRAWYNPSDPLNTFTAGAAPQKTFQLSGLVIAGLVILLVGIILCGLVSLCFGLC